MKILVVDDEASLRDIAKTYLEAHGHEVVTAADGVEAVSLFRHAEVDFDFVLTDYQMPRMNGVVLLMELKKLSPATRVALYSADPPRRDIERYIGEIPVLEKPVSLKKILEVVQG